MSPNGGLAGHVDRWLAMLAAAIVGMFAGLLTLRLCGQPTPLG